MSRKVPIGEIDLYNLRSGARMLGTIVSEWANRLNPNATIDTAIEHMRREFEELRLVRSSMDPYATAKELAGIALLALHAITLCPRDLAPGEAVHDVIYQVMQRNGERDWNEPDAAGVVEHVRDEVLPANESTPRAFDRIYPGWRSLLGG